MSAKTGVNAVPQQRMGRGDEGKRRRDDFAARSSALIASAVPASRWRQRDVLDIEIPGKGLLETAVKCRRW